LDIDQRETLKLDSKLSLFRILPVVLSHISDTIKYTTNSGFGADIQIHRDWCISLTLTLKENQDEKHKMFITLEFERKWKGCERKREAFRASFYIFHLKEFNDIFNILSTAIYHPIMTIKGERISLKRSSKITVYF
jgi:hypothetical protein